MLIAPKLIAAAAFVVGATVMPQTMATWGQQTPQQAPTSLPSTQGIEIKGRGFPQLTPFSQVGWQHEKTFVVVRGKWCELIAINGVPSADIVEFISSLEPEQWQKRFKEDLVEILTKMGDKPGDTVSLQLKDVATKQSVELKNVRMTSRSARSPWAGFPLLSPFSAVRWPNDVPEVQVDGKWYRLEAINDVPVGDITDFAHSMGEYVWQELFEQDLVELIAGFGVPPDADSVDLKLVEITSGKEMVLKDVEMTQENRDALKQARADAQHEGH